MNIVLSNVKKSYGERDVLKGVDYTFSGGKIYVIKGVSGCGKTTLLNIIGGIEKDYEGIISVSQEKCRVGYIFQQSLLLSKMTVMENLKLITDDEECIRRLSIRCGIETMLDKYPEQLSGGERQRIAVERALINNPEILLCDEPTASLNMQAEKQIASMIADCRKHNRVIIIATHSDSFDSYADVIVNLEYGSIAEEICIGGAGHEVLWDDVDAVSGAHSVSTKKAARMAFKRHKDRYSISALFPLTVMFLVVYLVSTVHRNVYSEYIRFYSEGRPTDILCLSADIEIDSDLESRMTIYDNLQAVEDGVYALYLMSDKASILARDDNIMMGVFPRGNNEILINSPACEHYFPGEKYENCLGRSVEYAGREFVISGIVKDADRGGGYLNTDNYYYSAYRAFADEGELKAIFVPYDSLSEFAQVLEETIKYTFRIMAEYPELLQNSDVINKLQRINHGLEINDIMADARDAQSMATTIVAIFTVIMVATMMVGCIYMAMLISGEMYYRRREIGYLQIFGVDRMGVKKLIKTEYSMKTVGAVLLAVMLYLVIILGYLLINGVLVFGNMLYMTSVSILLAAIYSVTLNISMGKYLKTDISTLISP
ncbi:MAG: ATP-binding cassette domain-containing protein [Lachnospiraceae bacterium]|nr:ATP-binding cassette domain-containing protein [Lachnospiraceae bacterium]